MVGILEGMMRWGWSPVRLSLALVVALLLLVGACLVLAGLSPVTR